LIQTGGLVTLKVTLESAVLIQISPVAAKTSPKSRNENIRGIYFSDFIGKITEYTPYCITTKKYVQIFARE
jgi:hypothetical protein